MSTLTSLSPYPIPAEDEALRAPVRAFLKEALRDMPAHVRAKSWSGYNQEFSRELGRRGWLGITLPKSLGGGGRSAFARYVLVEEFLNAGAPVGSHWIADRQSGPLILKYGTPEQQQFYIPRICRGEAFFCIGMSEPNSGSDLAGVKTRATRTDKGWLLNGQKIWTTNAHHCHYMIALVRSSGEAGTIAGIILFIFGAFYFAALVAALRDRDEEAARAAADLIGTRSPVAVSVALASIRRAAALQTLEEALVQEYRVSCASSRSHDLVEGIRAQIVDKDRNPRWHPASLSAVSEEDVERYFQPADPDLSFEEDM